VKRSLSSLLFFAFLFVALAQIFLCENAYAVSIGENDPPVPPERSELENIPKLNKVIDENSGLPFDIRFEAMREAALSYGARGGLYWRTYHIRKELEARESYMDKVYNFGNLLIAAPSGLLIEPPVVSEDINALIIDSNGQQAAVSDRILSINKNARIVSAPRTWRNYLERDWDEVTPPPDILLPSTAEERLKWIKWIRKGWEQGINQADEIFQEDIESLISDYQGMIRYRTLLAQNMISPPYALQTDRGITGGGNMIRIGDRAVEITGKSELIAGSDKWKPASR
jgi:defect-in-organelle-trafficking protein DotC